MKWDVLEQRFGMTIKKLVYSYKMNTSLNSVCTRKENGRAENYWKEHITACEPVSRLEDARDLHSDRTFLILFQNEHRKRTGIAHPSMAHVLSNFGY